MGKIDGLLEFIFRAENGGKLDYNVVYGGIKGSDRPSKPLTEMTVGEVLKWQDSIDPKYNSEAAGALQIMEDTLRDQVKKGTVSASDVFNEGTQKRLAVGLLKGAGLDQWQAGKMSTEDFGNGVAKVWASLPALMPTKHQGRDIPRGGAFYGGVGANKSRALVSAASFESQLGAPGQFISTQGYAPTGTKGASTDQWQAGGARPNGRMAQRMATQFNGPALDPYRHMAAWDAPDVSLDRSAFDNAPAPDTSNIPDYNPRYATRPHEQKFITTPGSWGKTFKDTWTDGLIYRHFEDQVVSKRYEWDKSFDPVNEALNGPYKSYVKRLSHARNKDHYDYLVGQIERDHRRDARLNAWDGVGAQTLGAITSLDSLATLFVPGGIAVKGGRGLVGASMRGALYSGAAETALEANRSRVDPTGTQLESIMNVGAVTLLGGLMGGVGQTFANARAARAGLAERAMADLHAMRGESAPTDVVKWSDGGEAPIRFTDPGDAPSGGRWKRTTTENAAPRGENPKVFGDIFRFDGKQIVFDSEAFWTRYERSKGDPRFKNAQEFYEFEVARAKSIGEKMRKFWRDDKGSLNFPGADREPFSRSDGAGGIRPDRKRIRDAYDEGKPITLGPARGSAAHKRGIEGVRIKASKFKSADEAEAAVIKAAQIAEDATSSADFAARLNKEFGGSPAEYLQNTDPKSLDVNTARQFQQEAEAEAETALEKWRKRNNRLMKTARAEAVARMVDTPFRRIHRNAFAGETRDLVDLLASDGGFARISDVGGVTVGPSVYSRAQTWKGITDRLWRQETDAYERYLGFGDNKSVADISLNKSFRKRRANGERALSVEEFRKRVSHAHITREKDAIPEVNEMAQNLRNAWDEYHQVAEEYGVLDSKSSLKTRMEVLRDRLNTLDEGSPAAERLQGRIDLLKEEIETSKTEPGEDYFTRVWNNRTIRENRDTFRDRIVMPWMRQQPYGDVFEEGYEVLGREIDAIKASGNDINHPRYNELRARHAKALKENNKDGKWSRMRFATDDASIKKRAEEMVDTILSESEPSELSTLREAHRPAFGRHRQFNIPNKFLLKEGQKGNGIADFIETDYMLLHGIYSERMGPAIEMARTFARPLDGVSARDGFYEAMDRAHDAEMKEFAKRRKLSFKKGNDAEIESGYFLDHPDGMKSKQGQAMLDKANAEWLDHWAAIQRDMLHLRDRVQNRVVRSPDRWDNRAATVLRNWSQLAFMGMSALPAIQEIGAIAMRHGLSKTMQHAFGALDENMQAAIKANIGEMRAAGGIIEVMEGAALSRFAETGMDAVHGTAPERWLRTASNKYFLWNGLAPLATRLKEIDAGIRVHDMVSRIDRVGKGVPTPADLEELARYGISRADAEAMANQPISQIEGGHWIANTEQWGDETLVRKFRSAIRQGNENTVLLATAADKPIIFDGVAYIRKGRPTVDKYAKNLGLEDQGDYWRAQSGLGTLPFIFWNYAIAAHSKILAAGLDEPSAQKLGGIAAMVGMGYMVSSLRDQQWNQKDALQKMDAALMQSGVTGVFPMMRNIADQNTMTDSFYRAGGAGLNVAGNAVSGLTGNVNDLSWSLPYRNHFLLKGIIDRAVDGIESRKDGVAG